MITDINISTKPVLQEDTHTNTYKLTVNFDYGEEIELYIEHKAELLSYVNMYQEYMDNLSLNWNEWCNPDDRTIEPLVEKYFPEEDDIYDFLYKSWSRDQEYGLEPLARVDSYTVTYFNDAGIELQTVIIKEEA
jgi:hypothetical protein